MSPTGADSADVSAERPADVSVERELPAELRSFEAALASISPNRGRLDHALIMFRAGQRSVAPKPGVASPVRSLAMPAGLIAMTTVAATLLAILIARPVIERVEIIPAPAADVLEISPAAAPANTLVKPAPTTDYPRYLSNHARSRAVTLGRIARLLEQDLRLGTGPALNTTGSSGGVPPAEPPTPYLQQLRALLDDQARASGGSHLPGVTAWGDRLDLV